MIDWKDIQERLDTVADMLEDIKDDVAEGEEMHENDEGSKLYGAHEVMEGLKNTLGVLDNARWAVEEAKD